MEPGQENEFADMRGWAAHHKISGKTVDLLIKEGFDSMKALILIDSDDVSVGWPAYMYRPILISFLDEQNL